MKKRILLIGFLLCSIIVFNLSAGFVKASGENKIIKVSTDIDDDGIDDQFESINRRKISVEVFSNEASILSERVSIENKDQIIMDIALGEDGITFQISYKSNYKAGIDFTCGITFRELIEFVDLDFDKIYNPENDQNIQNFTLKDFSPINYEKLMIRDENYLHHLTISTKSENFSLEVYFAEEFTLVNNSLITPSQAKIIVKIANFGFLNGSSQLALNTKLDSEEVFLEQEITEDEEYKFAKNETGITTTISDHTSFFTWNEIATIDGASESIIISEIIPDGFIENGQKFYINYPRGNTITHTTKIGIENLLIEEDYPLFAVLFLILAIGSVTSVVSYSIYYQKKSKISAKGEQKYRKRKAITKAQNQDLARLFNGKLALQIIEGEDAINKLYSKGDINITAISADFYETIDSFGFKINEKNEFIREMLSLPPLERELILRDMIIKSQ